MPSSGLPGAFSHQDHAIIWTGLRPKDNLVQATEFISARIDKGWKARVGGWTAQIVVS